jgi:hypothetical protein
LPHLGRGRYNAGVPRATFPSRVAAALLLIALAPAAEADSDDVEQHLIVAEDAFLDVEYETALEALTRAESETGATEDQLARLLALRGTILFLQGDEDRARVVYTRLLTLDPSYSLPGEHPPRASAFFDGVRAETASPPEVDHRPPGSFRASEPLEISATVRNATAAHSVRIFYRRRGERGFSSVEMARLEGERFVGTIPTFAALGGEQSGSVEYFILVALGEDRVANAGTPRRPLSFSVSGDDGGRRPPSTGGVASQWWFWTAIGAAVAVAVGLGVGLAFGLPSGQPSGDVEVTFRFIEE